MKNHTFRRTGGKGSAEFGSPKRLKFKKKRGQPSNSNFLHNWFHPEIRSHLFNLYKFQDPEKSTPESCRMH